ncbi:MAG: hypothetical protein V4735_06655 [Pseudomonadota bacterium]
MGSRIVLKDEKNGVSVTVQEPNSDAPEVTIRKYDPAPGCAATVPVDHSTYAPLVALARSAGVAPLEGAAGIEYTKMDFGTQSGTFPGHQWNGVGSTSRKGEMSGDLKKYGDKLDCSKAR